MPKDAPIRHVLVLVDGTESAERAVQLAVELARALRTRLTGLTVIELETLHQLLSANVLTAPEMKDFEAGLAESGARHLEAARALHAAGARLKQRTYFFISNYEEVGHGAATGIPADAAELVVVDMAAIGEGQTSDEYHATICVKDSSGPYHHGLSNHLRKLADEHQVPYRVDIYPYYGSDGSAFWRAGGDIPVALIGPGVDASHNYERTHTDALIATTNWILAYLLS